MMVREMFVLALVSSIVWAGALADCFYGGKNYPPGQMNTGNPCELCTCLETDYQAICAAIDCPIPMPCPPGQVRYRDPKECCTKCVPKSKYGK